MAESPLVLEFLRVQAGIRAAVEGRLTGLIVELARRGESPEAIRDAVIALVSLMVREYGQAAADFAVDFYEELRFESGVRGRYVAAAFALDHTVQVEQTIRRLAGELFVPEPDVQSFASGVAEKASQYIVDGARNTVAENSYRDPLAYGWRRVPVGATCDFCLLLVGRGGVYKRETALFRSHRHCDCGAAPSWDATAVEVPSIAYQASSDIQNLRDAAAAGDRSAAQQLAHHRERVSGYIARNQREFAHLRQEYNLTPAV